MSKDVTIPEGATHVWTYAVDNPKIFGWYAHRLAYYKQVEGEWWVYSEVTGWRKSGNDASWFNEETAEGFFVTVEEYLGN